MRNIPNPVWKRLDIEDDSDCETCQLRNSDQFQLLTEIKCKVLDSVPCPECGRGIDLFVTAEGVEGEPSN